LKAKRLTMFTATVSIGTEAEEMPCGTPKEK